MEKVMETLLLICLYSGLIYLAVMAFRAIFRRKAPPALFVLLWLVFVARLAVPVTFDVPFHLFRLPAPALSDMPAATEPAQSLVEGAGPEEALQPDTAAPAETGTKQDPEIAQEQSARNAQPGQDSQTSSAASFGAADWIMLILIAGAAAMVVAAAVRQIRLRRFVRANRCVPPEHLGRVFEQEKRRLGIGADVRLWLVRGLDTPALTLLPGPAVLVPAAMAGHQHVAMAVRHELMHYRRRDHLLVLAVSCLQIVWWFNPFVHLAARGMRQDIEAACDAAVVRGYSSEKKAVYAGMLIAMSRGRQSAGQVLGMSPAAKAADRIRAVFGPADSGWKPRSAAAFLAAVLAVACFTTACQPTPEEAAVGQKESTEIEQRLEQQASDGPAEHLAAWIGEESYPTGQTLKIEAAPEDYGSRDVPVAEVDAVQFTPESARRIAAALFPGARLVASERTKQQIAAEMDELEKLLVEVNTDPSKADPNLRISSINMPQTPEEWEAYEAMSASEKIELALEGFQTEYDEAPDAKELRETDYSFTDSDGSSQLGIMPEDGSASITFANWDDTGSSSFSYRSSVQPAAPNHAVFRNLAPDAVPKDAEYDAALEEAEDFASKIAPGPLMLQDVSCEEVRGGSPQYSFRFVPVVAGYPATVPANFVGTQSLADGETAQALAGPEVLEISVENGSVFRASWISPSEYEVTNGDVAVISFEEAKDTVLRQFGRLLVPEAENMLTIGDNNTMELTDARLGLAKMLVPGTSSYRMVPVWTFSGNQASDRQWSTTAPDTLLGETIAFVTVNATDGSIVDRGTMS